MSLLLPSYQGSLLTTGELLGGPGISGCQVKEDAVLDLGGSEVPEEKERVRALISALHHRVKFFTD